MDFASRTRGTSIAQRGVAMRSLSLLTTTLLLSRLAAADPGCAPTDAGPLAPIADAVGGAVEARKGTLCADRAPGAIEEPGLPAPPKAPGRLFIVNKGPTVGDPGVASVMVLDLTTGKVESTSYPEPQGPHEVAISSDGRTAVAPNYGLARQGDHALPGEGFSLTVADTWTGKLKTIDVSPYYRPHGVEFLDRDRVAVTVDGKNRDLSAGYVLIVNVRTGKLERALETKQPGSHLVRLSADGSKLLVTNIQGGSLTVLDRASGRIVKTIATGKGAEGIDISPDGREIWVANLEQDGGTMTVIDASTLEKKETFVAPGGPIRVKFTNDGSRVFTSDRTGNALTVYDAKTRKQVGRVAFDDVIGKCDERTRKPLAASSVPMQIVMPPDSPYAYVANSHAGIISVVDQRSLAVAGHYKGGVKPDPMAWYAGPPASLARYPKLLEKYPELGGTHRGTYSGVGPDGKYYELPRRVDPKLDGTRLAAKFPVRFDVKGRAPCSMEFDDFLAMIESTIPEADVKKIDAAIAEAKRLAELDPPLAAPFPYEEEARVRHTMLYTWLHARDLTVIQEALGYPLDATGHDQYEDVKAKYLKAQAARTEKSAWYRNYLATLADDDDVNVGFMNPHWIADVYRWDPNVQAVQDAMDAHRLSDHHGGNPEDGLDVVEAATNNVYHRREWFLGVRKEAAMRWMDIGRKLEKDEEAAAFIKSGVGVGVARDTAALMEQLEREGKIVPWHLVCAESEPAS